MRTRKKVSGNPEKLGRATGVAKKPASSPRLEVNKESVDRKLTSLEEKDGGVAIAKKVVTRVEKVLP